MHRVADLEAVETQFVRPVQIIAGAIAVDGVARRIANATVGSNKGIRGRRSPTMPKRASVRSLSQAKMKAVTSASAPPQTTAITPRFTNW